MAIVYNECDQQEKEYEGLFILVFRFGLIWRGFSIVAESMENAKVSFKKYRP